jgi:DNA-binding transcriptional MerR regulator
MGYRHRRMYYATGMPGWLRFGYSPGWLGRSQTGLPPTAEWIVSSGMLPPFSATSRPFGGVTLTREQEREMLEQQAKDMELQIEEVKRRLDAVRSGRAPPQPYPYPTDFYGVSPYGTRIANASLSAEEELASLEDYRKYLDEETRGVQARIEELKKQIARIAPEGDETKGR